MGKSNNDSSTARESNHSNKSNVFRKSPSNSGWQDSSATSPPGHTLSPSPTHPNPPTKRKSNPGTLPSLTIPLIRAPRIQTRTDDRELHATKYQLTQDVFDALIPAGTLGYLPFMDEGLIGLAGVVSSLLGGYTQWIKTK